MAFNANVKKFARTSLGEFDPKYNLKVLPAKWAFAIWGVIYLGILVFVVYQALPSSYVPTRNNELIFGQIGYWFAGNMALNALWLVIFTRDTKATFVVAFITISTLLYTCLHIMFLSTSVPVNTMEGIFVRGTFSIYAGWVTGATAIGFGYMVKSQKLGD